MHVWGHGVYEKKKKEKRKKSWGKKGEQTKMACFQDRKRKCRETEENAEHILNPIDFANVLSTHHVNLTLW